MSERIDVEALKQAAHGRWDEIISTLGGIPRDILDGRHYPCPKCRGTDRFRAFTDGTGGALCSQCFSTKNGDGIATLQWITGDNFPTAARRIAEFVGMPINGHSKNGSPTDALTSVCNQKRMPIESAKAYGARAEGLMVLFPSWGPDGAPLSEFSIWAIGSDKKRKGMWPKGGKAGVFLPVVEGKPRLPAAGETWLLVEGAKDAAALHGLGFLALGLNTCKMNQRFAKLLRGCNVILVPDRDTASTVGFEDTARKLYGVAATIKIAALPAEVTEKDGKDVRDILSQADGEQLVRQAIDQAAEWVLPVTDDPAVDLRPRIYAGPKEHEVATQAVKALAAIDGLYQRGGNLVSIVQDPEPPKGITRPPGSLYICPVEVDGLLDRLSQAACFYKTNKEGEDQDVAPPLRIAKIVQSRKHWPGVPTIEGVIRAPVFLADGSVLTQRGYCRETGLFLAADIEFPAIQQSPTLHDAQRARDELLEVVCDFPFAGETHRAAWLAIMLTPAARFAFDGPVPLGSFDANVRGCGKSKLADSIGVVHLGTDMPRTACPASDDEFRKQITSVLLAAERMMLLDNVAGMLGCASLDALLTATGWNDRILRESKMTGRLAASTIWMASGNNLVFSADTARRALVCRIESHEENPEEREGFRHADLIGWVRENRARLAVAAVTVLRAYHVAGRPKIGLSEWGSFEGWSNLVRNAVVWCGLEDPGATRTAVREQSDREAGLLRQLLSAWESADLDRHGLTVAQAIEEAASGNKLLQAVFAEIGSPGKPPSTRSIGMKLHHLRGRVSGGRFFERRKGSGDATFWTVQRSGTTGTSWTTVTPRVRTHAHAHAHTHAHEQYTGTVASPTSPLSPGSTTDCNHDYQERTTLDGWIRTECRLCGDRHPSIADRPPQPEPAQ